LIAFGTVFELNLETMRRNLFICLLLAGITLTAFWPVGQLGFSIYDDQDYVVQNTHIQGGITADSVDWAFSSMDVDAWIPVTWLSHMLGYQWFGLRASGHHWMNLGLHIANVLLLFLALQQFTRRRGEMTTRSAGLQSSAGNISAPQADVTWSCALVAALFAVHPLRVESVAWVAERKDVLSGFFFLLTLLAYARYARRAEDGRWQMADGRRKKEGERSKENGGGKGWGKPMASGYYWLALGFFALGLMSKPMLVTLPFILLLLDAWPLKRVTSDEWRVKEWKGLVLEKIPFFLLTAAACVVTIQGQQAIGSVVTLSGLPLEWRLENSLVAYAAYLGKILWPENLAILYPIRSIPAWEWISSGIVLAGVTAVCLGRACRQPYLFVGWGWFLVMLLPVIGLVTIGKQSMADRYTYLPAIGLFIIVAWGMANLAARSKRWQTVMFAVGAGMIFVCLPLTRHQLGFWQNDVALFRHAVTVTPAENYEGYLFLGNALVESGDLEAAVRSYETSLQTTPEETTHLIEAHYNLGCVLARQKHFQEAELHYGEALRLDGNNAEAHAGRGRALISLRKYTEAKTELATALALQPGNAGFNKDLAMATVLAESEIALTNFLEMLKSQPSPEIHVQAAAILVLQGKFADAAEHYQAALKLKPDAPDILNNLAWFLSTCADAKVRDGAQAVKYAERACELTNYQVPTAIGTLAAAYAEAGQFDQAIATAERACDLATKSGQTQLVEVNRHLLELYRQHQSYRGSAKTP
jgi:tetratricopeptide (TPR) repeat protein